MPRQSIENTVEIPFKFNIGVWDMLPTLEAFKDSVNTNGDVQRVTRGWNSDIILDISDSDAQYTLSVRDGSITVIRPSLDASEQKGINKTLIRGDMEVLEGIFKGELNAIRANNDGAIQIYGGMSEQVKLDAIALILWGI